MDTITSWTKEGVLLHWEWYLAPHRLLKQEGTEVDGFAFYFIPEYYLTLLLIFVEIKKELSLTVVCVDNERFFHRDLLLIDYSILTNLATRYLVLLYLTN